MQHPGCGHTERALGVTVWLTQAEAALAELLALAWPT